MTYELQLYAFCFGLFCCLSLLFFFKRWKRKQIKNLNKQSRVIETPLGPIEFIRKGSGAAVLVLHGSPGGYDQSLPFLEDLFVKKGFQIIAPSRPGSLRTPINVGKTPEEQADAMAGLLKILGIKKAALLSISGGGLVALQLALRHPQLISSLILLSSATQRRRKKPKILDALFMTDFFQWALRPFQRFWAKSALLKLEPKALIPNDKKKRKKLENILENMGPASRRLEGYLNDLEQYAKVPPYPLNQIQAPTLIIHGKIDPQVPLSDAKACANSIPLAELFEVNDGGHLLMLNHQAEKIEEKIINFLEKHTP